LTENAPEREGFEMRRVAVACVAIIALCLQLLGTTEEKKGEVLDSIREGAKEGIKKLFKW
jgi:hypothetical protein